MKRVLSLLAGLSAVVTLTAVFLPHEVRAQSAAPWCLRIVPTRDYSVDRCDYRTLAACQRDRALESNMSSCIRNPAVVFRRSNPNR
jgi:hypothetical protein